MPGARLPCHESNRFAFYILNAGAAIVRRRDNKSVYFQPGDDTARAVASADHCFGTAEMFPGENAGVFNQWCADHFGR